LILLPALTNLQRCPLFASEKGDMAVSQNTQKGFSVALNCGVIRRELSLGWHNS